MNRTFGFLEYLASGGNDLRLAADVLGMPNDIWTPAGAGGPVPVFSVPFSSNANAADGTTPTFTRASTAYGTRVVGGQMELVEFALNEPRVGSFIDLSGATQSGVLVEGSKENEAQYTDDFSSLWWVVGGGSVAVSTTVAAPDPTKFGVEHVRVAGTGTTGLQHSTNQLPATTGEQRTTSVWARAGDQDWAGLLVFGTAAPPNCFQYANLATGAAGTTGSGADDGGVIGPYRDGWYLIWMTWTADANDNFYSVHTPASGDNNRTITSDGTTPNTYWAFAQHELGALSSYIPSTSAPTTRAADSALLYALSPNILGPLTAAVEFLVPSNPNGTGGLFDFRSSGNLDLLSARINNASGVLNLIGRGRTGVLDLNTSGGTSYSDGLWRTLAVAVDTNDVEAYIGGVSSLIDTSHDPIGTDYTSVSLSSPILNGWIGNFNVYDQRLTDAQIGAL